MTLTSRLVLNLRIEHERSAQAGLTTTFGAGTEVGTFPGSGRASAGMNFASRVFANFTVDMQCEEGSILDSESDSERCESYEMTDTTVTSRGCESDGP